MIDSTSLPFCFTSSLLVVVEVCVQKHFFLVVFWFCFRFALWFGVCLVEVVVVGGFFQHGCGKKPIGCGVLNIGCGSENQKIQNIHSMTSVSFHLLLLDIITEPDKGTLEEGGSAKFI